MRLVTSVEAARADVWPLARPLGLVPTMGFLHDGHMALVRQAREDNDSLVVSIFVNPAQFGPGEDFEAYPRDVESDLSKLREAGVDVVFAPSVEEMYRDGFETRVEVGRLGERLEGKSRPGHFTGVATVVCKLLTAVRPDKAYFGEKDAQQCLVVTRMAVDLDLGAEIVVVPTLRQADGLALSSRNAYLGLEEKRAAAVLYRALSLALELRNGGLTDADELRHRMRALIDAEPLATVDYVSVSDAATLEELSIVDGPARALVAARIGPARLIDNVAL